MLVARHSLGLSDDELRRKSKKSQPLNEAVARSRRACPERSRGNLGDDCWQMLSGAFRPLPLTTCLCTSARIDNFTVPEK
jgi:hypothetical protein